MSDVDLADVWARSLDGLAEMGLPASQLAWLRLTRPLGLVENTALIATPNPFVKEYLETKLRPLVIHALSKELGRPIQIAVTVDPSPVAPPEQPPSSTRQRRARRLPLSLSGGDSTQTAQTRAFAEGLQRAVEVPVELYDERFTTVMARRDGGSVG